MEDDFNHHFESAFDPAPLGGYTRSDGTQAGVDLNAPHDDNYSRSNNLPSITDPLSWFLIIMMICIFVSLVSWF